MLVYASCFKAQNGLNIIFLRSPFFCINHRCGWIMSAEFCFSDIFVWIFNTLFNNYLGQKAVFAHETTTCFALKECFAAFFFQRRNWVHFSLTLPALLQGIHHFFMRLAQIQRVLFDLPVSSETGQEDKMHESTHSHITSRCRRLETWNVMSHAS